MDDENLPGIRQISAGIRWLIELQIVIAVPALMFSAVAIVASELAGGGLLSSDPNFVFVTSLTQAIGIEGAFFSNMIHARQAFNKSHHGRGTIMILIGIILCVITVLAMVAGNFESAFGLDTKDALFALGINTAVWAWIRAIVYGIVSFADAYMFYVPASKLTEQQVKDQIEQQRLKSQLVQENSRLRGENLKANLGIVGGVIGQVVGRKPSDSTPDNSVDTTDKTTELSPENPPDSPPENTENSTPENQEPPVPTRLISNRDMWTWQDLQQYIQSTYSRPFAEKKARDIVRFIGNNHQDNTQRGQPYVAEKKKLMAWSKKQDFVQERAVSNE